MEKYFQPAAKSCKIHAIIKINIRFNMELSELLALLELLEQKPETRPLLNTALADLTTDDLLKITDTLISHILQNPYAYPKPDQYYFFDWLYKKLYKRDPPEGYTAYSLLYGEYLYCKIQNGDLDKKSKKMNFKSIAQKYLNLLSMYEYARYHQKKINDIPKNGSDHSLKKLSQKIKKITWTAKLAAQNYEAAGLMVAAELYYNLACALLEFSDTHQLRSKQLVIASLKYLHIAKNLLVDDQDQAEQFQVYFEVSEEEFDEKISGYPLLLPKHEEEIRTIAQEQVNEYYQTKTLFSPDI